MPRPKANLNNRPEGASRRSRPTFGFIVNWGFTNPYTSPMWWGAVDAAEALDVNLIGFDINTYASRPNRSIYSLIRSPRLDGLALVEPGFPQPAWETFGSIPVVNIGHSGDDFVTSILVDNYGGMRAVVRHLIEFHACRKLAFIKGPANNPDAHARYRAYVDELVGHGLAPDPELCYQPFDWSPPGGQSAVRAFLDERKLSFDALIAANDNMALSAIQELQARGLHVPYDVAVCGFDDSVESPTSMPPLTTVHQPLREMGRLALEALSAHINGRSVPPQFVLPVSLIERRSCGCSSESILRVNESSQLQSIGDVPAVPVKKAGARALLGGSRRKVLLDEMKRALSPGEAALSVELEGWLEALITDLEKGDSGEAFLKAIDLASRQLIERQLPVTELQNVLSALRREGCRAMAGQPGLLALAENIWHRGRVFLDELVLQQQKQNIVRLNNQMAVVRSLSQAMAVTFHLDNLLDILIDGLKQLGVTGCYLSLLDGTDVPAQQAQLVLAFAGNQRLQINRAQDKKAYPIVQLLPEKYWGEARRIFLLEALEFEQEEIGYVLFEAGPHDGGIYEAVRSQLGSSVKGALLFDERDQLLEKTRELYQQATEGQRLAEEANRLKSRFLSMVSHELRTPLNVISGLSELTLWDVNKEKPVNRKNLERLHVTAQHLDGLIRDVLDLARDEMGELKLACEPLDVAKTLDVVVMVGEQMAREKGLGWKAQISPGLPLVFGDRTRLRQVVLNLINNSVKFTNQGSVSLEVTPAQDSLTISVTDTGLGIPPAEQELIFDEFRQSDQVAARGFGGLGLGLAICKRLVTLHGGEISVYSSGVEGQGAIFSFTLPTMHAASLDGKPTVAVWILTPQPEKAGPLKQYLAEQGFKAEILFWDEKDAWLAAVTQSHPEAIVLDIHHSSERGWDVMRILKAQPATSETTVLFYLLDADQNNGAMLELDYLSKPIGAPELAQALWRIGWAENNPASPPSNTKTILIVDDDPGVLDMHAQIVRGQFPQAQILLAANGKEALLLLQTSKPDLVLLDLIMPELDGFSVLEAMQKMDVASNIPVIVLSARTLSDEEISRLSRGVVAILRKGMFSASETLEHIKDALAHRQKLNSEGQRLTRKAMTFIHEHFGEPIGRDDIAYYVGVSEGYLSRSFMLETGLSLIRYLTRYRIQQAKQLLATTDKAITKIAMDVGFSDSNYFSRVFHQEVGVSPVAYRQGNHNPTQSL